MLLDAVAVALPFEPEDDDLPPLRRRLYDACWRNVFFLPFAGAADEGFAPGPFAGGTD